MLPARWGRMHELSSLQREFDKLLHMFWGVEPEEKTGLMSVATPAINSFVKDGLLHLEAELPGVDAEKLDVRIDGHEIVITGERQNGRTEEKADYLLQESCYDKFIRRLRLPESAVSDKAKATYQDGMLIITMPVTEAKTAGRKLTIEGLEPEKQKKELH